MFLTHLVLIIIGLFVLLFLLSFFLPGGRNTRHGSARFTKSRVLGYWNKGIQIGCRSLTPNTSYQHVLICGPSGSGKSQLLLAKNVFRLAKRYSVIVTDPKLELYQLASGYCRNKLKAKVYVMHVSQPDKSITWNPLHGLELKDVQGLMTTLYDIGSTSKESEAFWKFGSIDLLTSLAKTLIQYNNGTYANLANLQYLLNRLQVSPDLIASWIQTYSPNTETRLAFQRYTGSEEKIKQGVLIGAINALVPFCSDDVLRISASHTLPDISTFRNQRSVLFLGLPVGEDSSYAPFITLFLSRFFSSILKQDLQPGDLPIACVLEEFGNLLTIPKYTHIVATVRDKRVMLMHCLQNLDQLDELYGSSGAETIANNCIAWVILPGVKSNRTLTVVAESLLGQSTLVHYDYKKQDHVVTARPLLTKDEIRRLRTNTCLFISGNEYPALFRLKPLYKSWWLRWKYGLRTIDRRLKSRYSPVTHSVVKDHIDYIGLETPSKEDDDQRRFTELLNKYFPE